LAIKSIRIERVSIPSLETQNISTTFNMFDTILSKYELIHTDIKTGNVPNHLSTYTNLYDYYISILYKYSAPVPYRFIYMHMSYTA
jgi:hypothetical protein